MLYFWLFIIAIPIICLSVRMQHDREKEIRWHCYRIVANKGKEVKANCSEAENIFLNGRCFEFYLLMKRFAWPVTAYYDSDHVICKIGRKFYDASGEVEKGRHIPMKKHYPELYKEWTKKFTKDGVPAGGDNPRY